MSCDSTVEVAVAGSGCSSRVGEGGGKSVNHNQRVQEHECGHSTTRVKWKNLMALNLAIRIH